MEERLIELETRMTFQEGTLADLNDVIIEQRGLIEALQREVMVLRERMKALSASPIEGGAEPPPPHY